MRNNNNMMGLANTGDIVTIPDNDAMETDYAHDDTIVSHSEPSSFMDVTDLARTRNNTSNQNFSTITSSSTTFINHCIGFTNADKSIPNELMGQWCFNLSESSRSTQVLLPPGTSGRTLIFIIFNIRYLKKLIINYYC